MSSFEKPYEISIPDSALSDLQNRLSLIRFPDELEDANWDYGVPLRDVQRLVTRWKDGYDWRQYERELNETLPMFTMDVAVEGHGVINVHYVHQRSKVVNAVPLLFVHGWPGSFIEVKKILPLLTASSPDYPSFHVVAIGLPGYGFSEAPRKKGFAGQQYTEVAHNLMLALGYQEYVTQGGDWGSLITRQMADRYGPKHVKAWHTNFPITWAPSLATNPFLYLQHALQPYTAREKTSLARWDHISKTGSAYQEIQDTKPQTLGYSLADSPLGLLAWIYEKLVAWTDAYKWDDDEVLNWISIYWFSRAGPAASIRIYYEMRGQWAPGVIPINIKHVPIGVSYFPQEMYVPPKTWVHTMGNVVFESEHEHGGHFAAHENPEALVGDLRKMFGKGGPAFGVVDGRNGYVH
ncbi:alpha/beta-hydrolase [Stereum hirsutum FP-91666 SS1]|uniref:alpha/beta-hydrolase n=1 Tax=Stereum hirsutum (strain FP-91666) TaxID=721885 RepID=UPI000440E428|nr:alpha/beta-hydrolase [Stereum hirsutum FP-91666 SS1]EIM89732.1 alpha/beta-hydrolase [Stereum hirsutum FP-91666 SS1]